LSMNVTKVSNFCCSMLQSLVCQIVQGYLFLLEFLQLLFQSGSMVDLMSLLVLPWCSCLLETTIQNRTLKKFTNFFIHCKFSFKVVVIHLNNNKAFRMSIWWTPCFILWWIRFDQTSTGSMS
jgi:hypothetical protein